MRPAALAGAALLFVATAAPARTIALTALPGHRDIVSMTLTVAEVHPPASADAALASPAGR